MQVYNEYVADTAAVPKKNSILSVEMTTGNVDDDVPRLGRAINAIDAHQRATRHASIMPFLGYIKLHSPQLLSADTTTVTVVGVSNATDFAVVDTSKSKDQEPTTSNVTAAGSGDAIDITPATHLHYGLNPRVLLCTSL